jgi:O-antigen/teichoic acid export membrane protein
LGFPLAALAWGIGSHVVILLYGEGFSMAGVYFEWLGLNLPLVFLNVGYATPLQAWGRQKALFLATLLMGLTNLFLNVLLVPRFGAPAAIVTTILTELTMVGAISVIRRKCFPIPWLRQAIVPILVCSLAAIAARALADVGQWWLGGLVGSGIVLAGILRFERDTVTRVRRSLLRKSVVP